MENVITIYTDGGSRGNPGPAALGVAIGLPINKGYSKYLGKRTNNEAEYEAVVFALKMDSNLAVQQLSGNWKIEGKTIVPLFIKIHNIRMDFADVIFEHIPREQNKEADALVNQELNRHTHEEGLFNL